MTKNQPGKKIALGMFLILALTDLFASTALEGVEWRLVEMSGAAVAPLPGDRQPSILFDSTKNSAAGYNGCNNYFGQYELNGQSLKFGPIATTRRACPDAESVIERNFLVALEKTLTWEIKDNKLSFLSGTDVLLGFTRYKQNEESPDIDSLTVNSTVYSSGAVALTNGEYRTSAAPGSASDVVIKLTDKRVFGTLNGESVGVVVIATSTGGSGTFYELALLLQGTRSWTNIDTILLGDRVKVHSVSISNNQLVVDLTTHASQDPICCPTLKATRFFKVQDSRLAVVSDESQPMLIGAVWKWVSTRYNNDTKTVPAKPENYTVSFKAGGKLDVKADCNLKGGTYTVKDKMLSMQFTHSTAAMCEPGSLEDQFIRDLTGGASFFFQGEVLYIDIKFDTGTMKFSR